jgi:lactoylglutathione lyase
MNKLAYTILYVADVEKSMSFYENAFGFERKFIMPEDDVQYGELITGDTTLSFCRIDLANSNLSNGFEQSDMRQKPFGIEIGITTPDVQICLDKAISCGGHLVEPPKEKPWGQTVAYLRDTDGFLIEICTAMG